MQSKPTLKAYKYRIYPTDAQVVFFAKTFGCCRFVWNKMLDEKLRAYKKKERIQRIIPAKYKEEFLFLKEVDELAIRNVQPQLDKAFKDHFRDRWRFRLPKFKKKKGKQSYTTCNVYNAIRIDFEKKLLYLPKLREGVRIELDRKFDGEIKYVTISKTKDGAYYAYILVETENPKKKFVEPKSRACGIVSGLEYFATITNDFGSYKIEYPNYLCRGEERLRRLHKSISRKQQGSKNFKKARLKLDKHHAYVTNALNDLLHKLSKAIVEENQVVVVEDINVKVLLRSRVAKSIFNSGWENFVSYLKHKVERYGRIFMQVDQFFSSLKICLRCGYENKNLKLCEIVWRCPVCSAIHDKDVNASIKLYHVGLGRHEVMPVEQSLVGESSPYGIPKKPSCDEAGSSTTKC